MHQIGSAEFPFPLDTTCFARQVLGILFQNGFQPGSSICYTAHDKAPLSVDIASFILLISAQMKPCFVISFLKLLRIGDRKGCPYYTRPWQAEERKQVMPVNPVSCHMITWGDQFEQGLREILNHH